MLSDEERSMRKNAEGGRKIRKVRSSVTKGGKDEGESERKEGERGRKVREEGR